ncbi:MAG TPA: hypothetical protein VK897_20060 [Anaerolineales bacterium]|nr:hypothetical protein [Anaerolineales bacterium]
MKKEAEIRIVIKKDGSPTQAYAISILEDLWHDYLFFKKQAELVSSSETVLLSKRYLRVAVLLLMSYVEGVANRWCNFLLEKNGSSEDKIKEYVKRTSLVKKCQMISVEAAKFDPSVSEPIIGKMKNLRNELVHLKGGNDWVLFDETSLEDLIQTESNVTLWMDTVEQSLGVPRHPSTKGLLDPFSSMGETLVDESSDP